MNNSFKDKLLADYEVCILSEKISYTRGYIYILEDTVFPNHIKVGKTTDLVKRLNAYNVDKPYPTANYTYISRVFTNKDEVEKRILDHIYNRTEPTTFSKEWFEIGYEALIKDAVKMAEEEL